MKVKSRRPNVLYSVLTAGEEQSYLFNSSDVIMFNSVIALLGYRHRFNAQINFQLICVHTFYHQCTEIASMTSESHSDRHRSLSVLNIWSAALRLTPRADAVQIENVSNTLQWRRLGSPSVKCATKMWLLGTYWSWIKHLTIVIYLT